MQEDGVTMKAWDRKLERDCVYRNVVAYGKTLSKLVAAFFYFFHRKGRSSPPTMALTLQKNLLKPGQKKASVYYECDNQVIPKSSPLQSLFVGNMTSLDTN